jgi:cellulose synthase/poly-beta-1,6-N-acetylglucosamine synthase-like glycosyltransferase
MASIEFTFWSAALLILYALIGYPLLTLLLGQIVRREVAKSAVTPRVTLIIAAYNEATVIARKLEQSLALEYPEGQLEILVADDGSTDGTDEIVKSFSGRGVRLHRREGRGGKTLTLNEAAGAASGEILVFSDATSVYNAGSIRALASCFADPSVGCVSGRVVYDYGTDVVSTGFKAYQRFAVAVRRAESRFGSLTSVSGAIHALRSDLFRPSAAAFTQDVADAVHAVLQGYRVVYENDATAREDSREHLGDEFASRVRMSVRANTMISHVLMSLFRQRCWGYLFQVVSHKLLRWWLWLPLALAFLSSWALLGQGAIYGIAALVQLLFYGIGLLTIRLEGSRFTLPGASALAFFLVGNAAMCIGALRFLRSGGMARWEPIR